MNHRIAVFGLAFGLTLALLAAMPGANYAKPAVNATKKQTYIPVPKKPVVRGPEDAICTLQMTDDYHFYMDAMVGRPITLVLCVDKWSVPCTLMSKVMNDLKADPKDKALRLLVVRADRCPNLTGTFELHTFPTLLVIKDGKLLKNQVGFLRKQAVEKLVSELGR